MKHKTRKKRIVRRKRRSMALSASQRKLLPLYLRANPESSDTTAVVFRTFRGDNSVIALFPYEPGNNDAFTMMSYQHIGQHGIADMGLTASYTRPSKPDEIRPLKEELQRIGYKLKIMSRIPGDAIRVRREKLQRIVQENRRRGLRRNPEERYRVGGGYQTFTLEEAKKEADKIFRKTGAIVSIVEHRPTPQVKPDYKYGIYTGRGIARNSRRAFPTPRFVSKGEHIWKQISRTQRMNFLIESFRNQITDRNKEMLATRAWSFLPSKVKIVFSSKVANVELNDYR